MSQYTEGPASLSHEEKKIRNPPLGASGCESTTNLRGSRPAPWPNDTSMLFLSLPEHPGPTASFLVRIPAGSSAWPGLAAVVQQALNLGTYSRLGRCKTTRTIGDSSQPQKLAHEKK
jgi:hypothetical protein